MLSHIIIPTITTDEPAVYAKRIEEFDAFAPRIHIDVTDGKFAPSQTLNLNQFYWQPADKRHSQIDLHLMLERPIDWLDQIVSLKPDRVILHAESNDAMTMLPKIFAHLRKFDIRVGVALLPETEPGEVRDIIRGVDSVLIFGGHLGYQGGVADLSQLDKISQVKAINSTAILEWDGGANADNVVRLAEAGINYINVGGGISRADDARAAYDRLVDLIKNID